MLDVLAALKQTRDETLPLFKLPEVELGKRYAPGKWTVRYLLHHLADAETVLYDRIRRAISEPNTVVWAFDQDAWANALNYTHTPMAVSEAVYAATRAAILYYAGVYYEALGAQTFVHSETGLRTLKQEFDKVASHNRHHLDQIARARQNSA